MDTRWNMLNNNGIAFTHTQPGLSGMAKPGNLCAFSSAMADLSTTAGSSAFLYLGCMVLIRRSRFPMNEGEKSPASCSVSLKAV